MFGAILGPSVGIAVAIAKEQLHKAELDQREALDNYEQRKQKQDEQLAEIRADYYSNLRAQGRGNTFYWDQPKDITEEVNKLKEPKRIE